MGQVFLSRYIYNNSLLQKPPWGYGEIGFVVLLWCCSHYLSIAVFIKVLIAAILVIACRKSTDNFGKCMVKKGQ